MEVWREKCSGGRGEWAGRRGRASRARDSRAPACHLRLASCARAGPHLSAVRSTRVKVIFVLRLVLSSFYIGITYWKRGRR